MANPGYPNMPGQMPPMGGPPMGGPPMGGPPMGGRPVRRGTSKAVPVVVSAGLAVGVFCGLLFGVGTGKEAGANPASASNAKKLGGNEPTDPKADPGAAPTGLGATSAKPVDAPKTGSGATPVAAAVAAGAGSPPTPPAKPAVAEKKLLKLKITLKPDAAAKDAKITIDGNPIDGLMADLPAETKSFKLEVKANGFHTFEKTVETLPDMAELNLEFELRKRSGGSGVRPPKRPDRPTSAGGGGLIDI